MRGVRPSLLAVAALSLALNLAGITWGLPARWHPDEKADLVAAMARDGELAPGSFINPSLSLYAMLPVVWLQQKAVGHGPWPLATGDPLLVSRALSALVGALAVLGLGLAVARHAAGLGVLPSLLLALAPGVVNLCHFATPEAWLLLLSTATLWLALEHLEGRASAAALGLGLGLAVSTKYTAAALLAPALAAVWGRRRGPPNARDRAWLLGAGASSVMLGVFLLGGAGDALAARLHMPDARLLHPEHALLFVSGIGRSLTLLGALLAALGALAARPLVARFARAEAITLGAAAALGFLLGTPFAALRPLAFLSDLAFNDQTRFEYKGLIGEASSYGGYFLLSVDALTAPLLAAAVAGLALATFDACRGRVKPILVSLAALAPYLLVASSGHAALRFLVPAWPAGCWLAASALEALPGGRVRRLTIAAVALRAAAGALLVVRLFFVDSRLLAARWLEAHVPVGATVDLIANHPGYGPPLPEGRRLRIVSTLSREMAPAERFREAARRYPGEASPWLILTASFYERFLQHPEQRPERARFFQDLLDGRGGFEVRARFRQRGWLRPSAEFLDPEITVLFNEQGGAAPPPLEPPLAPRE